MEKFNEKLSLIHHEAMNFIKFLIVGISLFLSHHVFSQNSLNKAKIDSLRRIYCIDCRDLTDHKTPLPPPSARIKTRTNFHCEKKYNIPDSLLLTVFPSNSDSILIAVPDHIDDPNSGIHILKKMNFNEIARLADILYNYDFRKKAKATTILSEIHRFFPPDIALIFYNNGKSDFLYLFFENNQIRIEDSFSDGIYWGEYCDERYNLLKCFFGDN